MSQANRRWRNALGGLLMAAAAGAFAPAGGLSLLPRSKARASHTASARKAACMTKISDARTMQVFESDAAVGEYICKRVVALAAEAIATKGGFSMSIGSGTTVKPLTEIANAAIDFSKVHIFFGNERVTGETAYKCFEGASPFAHICRVPSGQVYRVPSGDAGAGSVAAAALEYEELIKNMPPNVLGVCRRTGLRALDLVLLGSGADGHCASLYPQSPQVLLSPSERLVVEAAGKGGTTFTLDFIQSARNVMISAPKPAQKDMVALALKNPAASSNTQCPAGMISAAAGTSVEWLLTTESALSLLE